DRLARSSGVVRDVVTDLVEPAGAEIAKPRNHQVILGREVAIERRLGNAGFRDQRVDAGSLDPDIAKQSRCCRQEAVPGGLALDTMACPRHASDDGARMKAEDVGDRTGPMPAEVVRTDDHVWPIPEPLVDARFVG